MNNLILENVEEGLEWKSTDFVPKNVIYKNSQSIKVWEKSHFFIDLCDSNHTFIRNYVIKARKKRLQENSLETPQILSPSVDDESLNF